MADPRPATPGTTDDDILATARDRFEQALSAEAENRTNYVADARFSCTDDQWADEVKRRRGANRPALTFNRLNGVVKQIIGDYRQNKLAMKVLPASGDASEATADILAGIIRNVEARSNADVAYVNALECSARGGFGYFRVLTEYTGDDVFDQDIVIRPVHNPLTVYMDPAARLLTREDANWCFVTEMVQKDEFGRLYPKATAQGFDGDDMENWGTGEQIRVAEYYEKARYPARLGAFSNGLVMEIADDAEVDALARIGITLVREREAERTKVVWRKLTGQQVLDTREYKTRYIPVVPVIGEEVNLEGTVYTRSAVYYAKDAQRSLNAAKSSALEMTALSTKAPWLVTATQIEGYEAQWATANTTPQSYLPYNPDGSAGGPPQRIEPVTPPAADMAMAASAGQEIQYTTGVFDASLGAPGQEVSGVAIGERQHQGATSTVVFVDNLKKAIEHCGRVLLDLIPTVYDAERVVRVLDLEGNPATKTINQRQYDPLTGVTRVLNGITVGQYDVTIDTGPNFASRRREALDAMLKLAQVYPQVMQVAGDLVVGTIDAPGMEAVAERVKRSMPPQLTTDPDSPEGQALKNQPPPVPPEVQMQQAEAQRKQQEFQATMQMKQQQAQTDAQLERQKLAAAQARDASELTAKTAFERQKFAYERDLSEREFALKAALEEKKFAMEQALAERQLALKADAHPSPAIAADPDPRLDHLVQAVAGMHHQHGEALTGIAHAVAAHGTTLDKHGAAIGQHGAVISRIRDDVQNGNTALLANAVATLAKVAAAPRKAVRDKAGTITGSEVVVE